MPYLKLSWRKAYPQANTQFDSAHADFQLTCNGVIYMELTQIL